jgi:hypothetical protein
MTPQYVQDRVEQIKSVAGDDEVAHGKEDALHQEVLRAIAEGVAENPAECARIALTTSDINFARWCA